MPWPGVWSNFIAKSGGNQYHGKIYADYQNKGVQAQNIDDSATFLCPGGRCGNLQPSDLNRLESYYDVNGDVGGYLIEGQAVVVRLAARPEHQGGAAELPGEGVRDRPAQHLGEGHLRDLDRTTRSPATRMGPEVAAQPAGHLPDRRHDGAAQLGDSTWQQLYWGHTYKAGYDSVLSDSTFVEVRGGQFKYVWPNYRYSEDPAYQDIGNQIVSGGNRDGWFRTPSRNQIAGSMTYFKDGWAGDHSFKVGGEWFRETFTDERGIDVQRQRAGRRASFPEQRCPGRGGPVRHAVDFRTGIADARVVRAGHAGG